jgi:acetoacetate decarboxylase
MLYALPRSDLSKFREMQIFPHFTGVEMLVVIYRTDPEIVRRILPTPLQPTADPLALAFVARYPETNFFCVYNEGALFVQAQLRGESGLYCLSMPVDDDMALIGGRENYGFPKKIAESITLEKDDSRCTGRVVRKGVEIMRIDAELTEPMAPDAMDRLGKASTDLEGKPCWPGVSYLFKFFPSANGQRFAFFPRLIRQVTLFRPRPGGLMGTAELTLNSSPQDPLGEVVVREVVSCFYGLWDNTMLPGRVVGRAWNLLRFLPHAFFKTDLVSQLLLEPPPGLDARQRKKRWRQAMQY